MKFQIIKSWKLSLTLDALNRPEQLKRPDSGHPLPVQSKSSVQLWTPLNRPEQTKRPEQRKRQESGRPALP